MWERPQGRIPPAREAEAVGEAAAQDLTVFTELDETRAHVPAAGIRRAVPRFVSS